MKRYFASHRIVPYVFVLPLIVSFLLFYVYPAASTIIMSFQDVVPGQTKFIGLANYNKLLNPIFFKALKNSFT